MTSLIRVSDVDTFYKYHSCISDEFILFPINACLSVRLLTILEAHRPYNIVGYMRLSLGQAFLPLKAVRSRRTCSLKRSTFLHDDLKQTKDKHMSELA